MNELNLSKCNLAQTATVSHTHTLGVFPPGKKKRQRFVVGDDAGAVTCFEMKRGEAVVAFAYATPSGEPIQNLTLNRNPEKRDRLFASQGQGVFGVSKKGNEVFRLVAPSTEPVHHLVVDETHLYTAGEFSFQLYTNAKDAGFYTANDHILALAVLPSEGRYLSPSSDPRAPDAILACGDRKLHVVRPRSGANRVDLSFEAKVEAAVTALCPLELSTNSDTSGGAGIASSTVPRVAYGTAGGGVGLLAVHEDRVEELFEIGGSVENGGSLSAGVALIHAYDLTGDGVPELCVARTDGTVQVYRLGNSSKGSANDDDDEYDVHGTFGNDFMANSGSSLSQNKSRSSRIGEQSFTSAREVFRSHLGESVRGLAGGQVSTAGFEELLCLTYSGKVVSFTTEPLSGQVNDLDANASGGGDVDGTNGTPDNSSSNLGTLGDVRADDHFRALQADLSVLKSQLADSKAALAEDQRNAALPQGYVGSAKPLPSKSSSSSSSSSSALAASDLVGKQRFEVSVGVELDRKHLCHCVTIEGPHPFELITLSSTVRLDLLRNPKKATWATTTTGKDTTPQAAVHTAAIGAAVDGENPALVGLTPSDGRCALLATYRFPQDDAAPCAKACLRFRANEGEAGEVTASIVSRTSPRAAQVVKFQVKPLNLHHRVHDLPSILNLDTQKARASAQAQAARQLADRADNPNVTDTNNIAQSSISEGKDSAQDEGINSNNNDAKATTPASSNHQDSGSMLTASPAVGAGASLDEFSAAAAALTQNSTTGSHSSGSSAAAAAAAAQAAALAEAAVAQWRLAAAARHEQWLTLDCRGSFSARMAHDWVTACLPDVPPRFAPTNNSSKVSVVAAGGAAPAKEEKENDAGADSSSSSFLGSSSSSDGLATLYFLNAYTGAELCVEYGEDIIRAKADSASAAAILRDVVTSKARDCRVEVQCRFSDRPSHAGCRAMLCKLDPLLQHQLGIAARCDLAAAVQEVVAAEADPNATLTASHHVANGATGTTTTAPAPPWLSSELRDVYDGAASATAELAAQPKQLQYISGVLTDLFVDWRKLAANEDARSKIPALHHLLAHDYSLDHLEHMFGL